MTAWNYQKGLQETGNGIYSYLQPDGSWGWSNSGLIVDGGQSLLVDTLFDAPLTREMLSTAAPCATAWKTTGRDHAPSAEWPNEQADTGTRSRHQVRMGTQQWLWRGMGFVHQEG